MCVIRASEKSIQTVDLVNKLCKFIAARQNYRFTTPLTPRSAKSDDRRTKFLEEPNFCGTFVLQEAVSGLPLAGIDGTI